LHVAKEKPYRLELLGIAAHVYMDTFSHYGFSGISSVYNTIKKNTIEFIEKPATYDYITKKFDRFIQKYTGEFAQSMSMALGHGGVATYPDRPYLKWKFEFTRSRPGNGLVSIRDNQNNFLDGCEKLHGFLSKFAQHRYDRQGEHKPFREIKDIVKSVISVEADREGRVKAWRNSGLIDNCRKYDAGLWENEKNTFNSKPTSKEGIETNAYRFHQAAAYHRYYVLKDLLPSHGIAVY
jgi:hypothetical protein